MKWFRYISVFFLCSLVIYTGAGVALMQFCCQGCRDMQADHNLFCQMQSRAISDGGCCGTVKTQSPCCCSVSADCNATDDTQRASEETCSVEIYRPDWLKQVFSPEVSLPVCDLRIALLPAFHGEADFYVLQPVHTGSHAPPLPGRRYLALYSTLLI